MKETLTHPQTAMIFAAGLGTRFKPWTDKHPKALAPVNGKSLLQRNIEYLQEYDIHRIIVNVHHFADQLKEAIEKNNGWGSEVLISDESDKVLETGGGLLHAKPFFSNKQPFITCNADILTELDIRSLWNYHQQQSALISFGVTSRSSSRVLLFDNEMRLCGWRNKNTGEEKISIEKNNLIEKAYSCVVIFNHQVFNLMDQRGFTGKFSLIDLYLNLASDYKIMGFDHTGDKLVDVGKPDSVAIAESLFP